MTFSMMLDYASVLVFALTGALVASRKLLDPVGFIFFAALTGVGGGTLRDLILDRPPTWITQPELLVITSVAALVVFFSAHLLESRARAILWLDAFALAIAVPAGVGVTLTLNLSPVIVVAMGVMTGTFGGMMRDVVANEVPLIFARGELYLTAAFGGAVAGLCVMGLGVEKSLALVICGLATFALRAGSLIWGWQLPLYKPRPPRK